MVDLALSALAESDEQIMPRLVVAIMSQLGFCGGMIPVTGRLVLAFRQLVVRDTWIRLEADLALVVDPTTSSGPTPCQIYGMAGPRR